MEIVKPPLPHFYIQGPLDSRGVPKKIALQPIISITLSNQLPSPVELKIVLQIRCLQLCCFVCMIYTTYIIEKVNFVLQESEVRE